ncbi:HVO_2072 family ArtA-dependent S-layer glycoprotein [Halorubrum sp. SY-15]|uniref:HVO_2072 family ArtA-dependent S-layer glycoprotein n=1 Tax=Halorubrum sp. SY-15 TaxID=3402277 RepID=UPI003EB91DC6
MQYTVTATDSEGQITITDGDTSDASAGETVVDVTAGGGGDTPSDGSVANRDELDDGRIAITDGNVVFQGEEELTFIDDDGNEVAASALSGTSGDREGTPLQMPIPQDEETGTYDLNGPDSGSGGFSTTVVEPRITTAEVQLGSGGLGDDISQVPSDRAGDLEIVAEYNFEEAENLDITVEDPSGSDITNQVLDDSTIEGDVTSTDEALVLDLADEDAGEYTVIFEGSNNLDYGDVIEEYTIETTSQDNIQLELGSDSATQGDNLEFTATGGIDGDQHLVLIEEADLRDGTPNDDLAQTFRNVGETVEVGLFTSDGQTVLPGDDALDTLDRENIEYAYAIVEMDGTQAPGAIETQYLDDSTVDVYVHEAGVGPQSLADLEDVEEDDVDFDVTEGDVTLDSPTDTYVVGEEVDVAGTASSADEVRLYAKDNNDWEIVQVDDLYTIDVDSDDTFEETDINLREGEGGGNNILAFEGRYEIGVISETDAVEYETRNGAGDISSSVISTSDWTTATSSRDSINVVEGDLTGEFVTYNGQIADEDNIIDVNGTAAGQDSVVVAFVDDRGNTQAYDVNVDNEDAFDEDDLAVDLNQGTVSAHVISNGRDGNIGDGDLPDIDGQSFQNNIGGLTNYIEALGGQGQLSGDQVRDRILTETVEDDASDDVIISQTFRLTDGTVSVDAVYPEGSQASGVNPVAAGDTMVVEGTTNRKADDNSVVVDVLDENGNSLASGSTDMWDSDGVYMVTIDTSDLETGSYTVEADTGDNTDRTTVEVVESVEEEEEATNETDTEEETEEETTEEETTEEETTEEESTEEETTEEESTEETTEEESTDDSTPGFGALVALVALVAAALLATRRRDE